MPEALPPLLLSGDSPPVEIVNTGGAASFLLTGDHAGNAVPSALATLGVDAADIARHIGWDIGVDVLGRCLAVRLDAAFVRQHYSRLVIDCNRDPANPDAMPAFSDGTRIPGNANVMAAARHQRVAEIHAPYHAAIAAALAQRGPETVLVALHSFTPVLGTSVRPWHIGVLHDGGNDGFARRLLAWLHAHARMNIGDNAPYRMDNTDHSVPRHAFAAERPYVELEVRQDLLANADSIDAIAGLLAAGLQASLANAAVQPNDAAMAPTVRLQP